MPTSTEEEGAEGQHGSRASATPAHASYFHACLNDSLASRFNGATTNRKASQTIGGRTSPVAAPLCQSTQTTALDAAFDCIYLWHNGKCEGSAAHACRARIVDLNGNDVEAGERGEIVV
jgi:hypothetical protein